MSLDFILFGALLRCINEFLLVMWLIGLEFLKVFDGTFQFGDSVIKYSSGSSIVKAPSNTLVLSANLTDIASVCLMQFFVVP